MLVSIFSCFIATDPQNYHLGASDAGSQEDAELSYKLVLLNLQSDAIPTDRHPFIDMFSKAA